MFRLERPSMAINDSSTSDDDGRCRRFRLETTWDVSRRHSRAVIIARVTAVARGATGGKLKNLVLSCHATPGFLRLGEGFGVEDLPLFAAWQGLVEKIWLPDCRVAAVPTAAERARGARDGNQFCSGLARQVRCYVVAPTELQVDLPVTAAVDMITSFEGLVLSYGPTGAVTWQHRYPSTYQISDKVKYFNP